VKARQTSVLISGERKRRRFKMKKALNVLGNFTLGVSLLLLLVVVVAPLLLGFTFNTIISESMKPTLKLGGVVGLKKTEPDEIQVGDIIGLKMAGMNTPVCHRVVEIVGTEEGIGFRTQGDAVEEADAWVVKPENLLGKVIFHVPWVGYAADFIKTPYGFVLLLGLPAVLIISGELLSMLRTARGKSAHESDEAAVAEQR